MKKKEQKAFELNKAFLISNVMLEVIKWWADLRNKFKSKRYVLHTAIIVQGQHESAAEFSETLNQEFEEFADAKIKLVHIQFTTSANGRQTCNIIYRVPK